MDLLKSTICLLLIIANTAANYDTYGNGGDQGGNNGDQGGYGGDQGGNGGDQGGYGGDQAEDANNEFVNNIGVEWMVGGAEYVKYCAAPKRGSVEWKKCRAGAKKSGAARSNPAIIGGVVAVVIMGITVIIIGE